VESSCFTSNSSLELESGREAGGEIGVGEAKVFFIKSHASDSSLEGREVESKELTSLIASKTLVFWGWA
jgi:hypothetical protein